MTPDSRLNHIRSTLDAALELAGDMYAENLDPHDCISLARAEKFILAAGQAIAAMSIYSPVVGVEISECGRYCVSGSRCAEVEGHEGPHRSEYGFKWTDEEDARAGAEIVRSMGGKTE